MKKNLVHSKKSKTTGSFFRLPTELKEEAQIWGIKNKMNLTDIIVEGIKNVIDNGSN
jgi:hypothetical protein